MKEHAEEFCLDKMAKTLGVCRTSYDEFLKRNPSKRQKENDQLIKKIKEAHKKGRETYGSPRIHKELKKQGETCSGKRVAKLMRRENIQTKMRKKWKKTTQVHSKAVAAPNSLNQQFSVDEPNRVWISDISALQISGLKDGRSNEKYI